MTTSPDAESLITDICAGDPATAAAALQAAGSRKEDLAPALLARLRDAARYPTLWDGTSGNSSPVFLCFLAAAWRLTDAHALIVGLLRLPPKECGDVLGDFISEGAKLTLADTWPGDLHALRSLAMDDLADTFARGAALDAAALLFARGRLPRETVLALLTECAALPLDPQKESHVHFGGQIISTILNLRAWELRGTVTALFERDLVDPYFCGDEGEVLRELPEGVAFVAEESRFPPPVEDAWEQVQTWCYFDELFPSRRPGTSRWEELAPTPRTPSLDAGGICAGPVTHRRDGPKVGRNDPCPCGSGRKFKKCCGA